MPVPTLVIVGPTASGKTALATALGRRHPVEVVSADSRQVRREMSIGTAAPTPEERAAVPHHLVGTIAPDAPWSLADFVDAAHAAIEDVRARGGLPVVVGGTAQYVWALIEGWSVPAVPADPEVRARLEEEACRLGGDALHARLGALDPASAARIDARNVRRVIRALEINEVTGAPVPPLDRSPSRDADDDWRIFGLDWPREALHARADARVEAMYAAGLVDETRALLDRYAPGLPALSSIGHAEAARVVRAEWTIEEAIARTKIETHRLIRMQATWFRLDDDRITWLDASDLEAAVEAVEAALPAPLR
ncbi:MAG: tRNA (adenosine(37)-N6)-dimethylallyltransferase MiaA [Dehalococcoidia bacterium]